MPQLLVHSGGQTILTVACHRTAIMAMIGASEAFQESADEINNFDGLREIVMSQELHAAVEILSSHCNRVLDDRIDQSFGDVAAINIAGWQIRQPGGINMADRVSERPQHNTEKPSHKGMNLVEQAVSCSCAGCGCACCGGGKKAEVTGGTDKLPTLKLSDEAIEEYNEKLKELHVNELVHNTLFDRNERKVDFDDFWPSVNHHLSGAILRAYRELGDTHEFKDYLDKLGQATGGKVYYQEVAHSPGGGNRNIIVWRDKPWDTDPKLFDRDVSEYYHMTRGGYRPQ